MLSIYLHNAHPDERNEETHASTLDSTNCLYRNVARFPKKMDELSNTNNTQLIGLSEAWTSQFTDQKLAILGVSLFHNDRKTGM